jgi:aminoglycoside phosphotransferase (APT) family kinase protein
VTEWEPEHAVSAAEAGELIGAQFPPLRDAAVEPLATGWDNTVFLVGGEWVFRFPRRTIALAGLTREMTVLPRLAPSLPLPIPVPEFEGRPSAGYPWPFWGARHVPGRELAEARPADDARTVAASGLGEFLRALHDPRLVAEVGDGLPYDPLRRADPAVRAPLARERLARLARDGVWDPDPAVERLLGKGESLGPPTTGSDPRTPRDQTRERARVVRTEERRPLSAPSPAAVVVHGDLHVRHLLVDAEGRAAGVIDWGDLCLADPAVDLSIAYGGFAGPARTALLSAYGEVDAERETRARVLAVFLCAALAEYAAGTNRESLLAESLAGIARAVTG